MKNQEIATVMPKVPRRNDVQGRARSMMEVVSVTPDSVAEWQAPPFQRPLMETRKVLEIADSIKSDGGIIPDVITLGYLQGSSEPTLYLLDGQHRRRAFVLSGCVEGIANVRYCSFASMGEMGDAFVRINTPIVRMRADDTLRAMSSSSEALQRLRRECPFIGYDHVGDRSGSTILSMAIALDIWHMSRRETPGMDGTGVAAKLDVLSNEPADLAAACRFFGLCYEAWNRETSSKRLWGKLNLTICAWIYRRIVIAEVTPQTRSVRVDDAQFRRCLMALAADDKYSDWLVNRGVGERNRGPAYAHVKALMMARLREDTGSKSVKLPQPAWAGKMWR